MQRKLVHFLIDFADMAGVQVFQRIVGETLDEWRERQARYANCCGESAGEDFNAKLGHFVKMLSRGLSAQASGQELATSIKSFRSTHLKKAQPGCRPYGSALAGLRWREREQRENSLARQEPRRSLLPRDELEARYTWLDTLKTGDFVAVAEIKHDEKIEPSLRHRAFRVDGVTKNKRKHFLIGNYHFDVQGECGSCWLTRLTPDVAQEIRLNKLCTRVAMALKELSIEALALKELEILAVALGVQLTSSIEPETELWKNVR